MSERVAAVRADLDPVGIPGSARSALYALFAELLSREVDSDTLQVLRSLREPIAAIDPGLGDWIDRADARDLEESRVEFARLFVLPGGVPPYASAWIPKDAPIDGSGVAMQTRRTMEALRFEQTNSARAKR